MKKNVVLLVVFMLMTAYLFSYPVGEMVPFDLGGANAAGVTSDGMKVAAYYYPWGGVVSWTEAGGMVTVDTDAEANAISDDGRIFGSKIDATLGHELPCYWDSTNTYYELPHLPYGQNSNNHFGNVWSCNSTGTKLGGMQWTSASGTTPVMWYQDDMDVWQILDLMPADSTHSGRINAVSEDGTRFAGWIESDDGSWIPSVWTVDENLNVTYEAAPAPPDWVAGEVAAFSQNGSYMSGHMNSMGALWYDDGTFDMFQHENAGGWQSITNPAVSNDGLCVGRTIDYWSYDQWAHVYKPGMGYMRADDYFNMFGVVYPADYQFLDSVYWVSADESMMMGWYYDTNWATKMFMLVLPELSYIEGNVTLNGTIGTVEEVQISVANTGTLPDSTGFYSVAIGAGTYDVTASMPGYITEVISDLVVPEGVTVTGNDFTLNQIPNAGFLEGNLTQIYNYDPFTSVTITADDGTTQYSTNGTDLATYQLILPAGTYDVLATQANCFDITVDDVVVVENQVTLLDFDFVSVNTPAYMHLDFVVDDPATFDWSIVKVKVGDNDWNTTYSVSASSYDGEIWTPGTYTVSVLAPGHQIWTQDNVEFIMNQTTSLTIPIVKNTYPIQELAVSEETAIATWDEPLPVGTYFQDHENFQTDLNIIANIAYWNTPLWPSSNAFTSEDYAYEGSKSLKIDTVDGIPGDIYWGASWPIPDSLTYVFEAKLYVPSGNCAHHGVLREGVWSALFAIEIFYRADGTLDILIGGNEINLTYPQDQWFSYKFVADLDNDLIEYYQDGVLLADGPYSLDAHTGAVSAITLGAYDISVEARPGFTENGLVYMDNYANYEQTGVSEATYTVNLDGALQATGLSVYEYQFENLVAGQMYTAGIIADYTWASSDEVNEDFTYDPPTTPLVFFSEYIEGSSNNKALEIYNNTGAVINLDDFRINQSNNGGGWEYQHYFPVGATLADGDVWVILNDGTDPLLYDPLDADEVLGYPSVVHHNGNDARGIEWTHDGGTTWMLIDVFGVPTEDIYWDVAGVPEAAHEHTLVRKETVITGNTDWALSAGTNATDSEWIVYDQDTFEYLGEHPSIPVLDPPTDLFVTELGYATWLAPVVDNVELEDKAQVKGAPISMTNSKATNEETRAYLGSNVYLDGEFVVFTTDEFYDYDDGTLIDGQSYLAEVTAVYDEGESVPIDYTFVYEPIIDPPTDLFVTDLGYATWETPAGGGDLYELIQHDGNANNAYFQDYGYGYGVVYDLSGYTNVTVEMVDFRHSSWGVFGTWDYSIHIVDWDTYTEIVEVTGLQTTGDDTWELEIDLGSVSASGLVGIFMEPMSNSPTDAYPCMDADGVIDGASYYGDLVDYSAFGLSSVGDFLMDLWIMGEATDEMVKAPRFAANFGNGNARIENSIPDVDFVTLNQTATTRDFLGFNVYLDGEFVTLTTDEFYDYDDGTLIDGQSYLASVTALYDEGESVPVDYTFIYQPVTLDPPTDLFVTDLGYATWLTPVVDNVELEDKAQVKGAPISMTNSKAINEETRDFLGAPISMTNSKATNEETRNFLGFNVYLDGGFIVFTTDEFYDYDDGTLIDGQSYLAEVTAVYDEGESVPVEYTFTYSPIPNYDPPTNVEVDDVLGIVTWAPPAVSGVIIEDNFDSYTVGDYIGVVGDDWTTWSGTPGGADDALVTDVEASSPSNSVVVELNQDLVLIMDDYTSGVYTYEMKMFVPAGYCGYFNIQNTNVPGTGWAFQIYFQTDGTALADAGAAGALTYAFNHDEWMALKIVIDLDSDWAIYYHDGVEMIGYQYSLGTFGGGSLLSFGGVNIFGGANSGTSDVPMLYFDDVVLSSESTRDLTGYNVYLDGDLVSSVGIDIFDYTYEGLVNGTEYTAGISADYDGEESEIIEVTFIYTGTDVGDVIIAATKLNGNYPNPFNPITTIAYSIRETGKVSLQVYNIKGQLVKTLVNDVRETGNYTVTWNGRDNSNKTVASGVYFYKMKAQNYNNTKKMILMK